MGWESLQADTSTEASTVPTGRLGQSPALVKEDGVQSGPAGPLDAAVAIQEEAERLWPYNACVNHLQPYPTTYRQQKQGTSVQKASI